MLLLALDTATDRCSVALLRDGAVRAEATIREPRSHAARLVPLIGDVLAGAGVPVHDLDAVAVSAGPGSFTGLRIGVSTAKGLAVAAEAALVAVPTLAALALGAGPSAAPVLTALPSRRGEVYAALYHVADPTPKAVAAPAALDLDALAGWLGEAGFPESGPLRLTGDGAPRVLEALGAPSWREPVEAARAAAAVGRLGWARFQRGETENVAAFEPYYLKAFVARPARPIFRPGERENG